jgi:hypothetical protein
MVKTFLKTYFRDFGFFQSCLFQLLFIWRADIRIFNILNRQLMQCSSLLIKNDETDQLDFDDLISVLKEHLKHVNTLHLEGFPIL